MAHQQQRNRVLWGAPNHFASIPEYNSSVTLVGTDRLSILCGLLNDIHDNPTILEKWLIKYKYTIDEIKNTDWYKNIPMLLKDGHRDLIDTKLTTLAKATPDLYAELAFFDECENAAINFSAQSYDVVFDFIRRKPHFLNLKDKEHRTALRIACRHKNAEFAEMLIARGADVNTVNFAGNTIMPYLLVEFDEDDQSRKILDMLFEHGADMYAKNFNNITLMQFACYAYNYDAIQYLLSRKYNVQKDEIVGIFNRYAEMKNPNYKELYDLQNNELFIKNYDKILNLLKNLKV